MPSSPFDHYALAGDTDSTESASLPGASKSASSSPSQQPRALMDTADSHSHRQFLQSLALFPSSDRLSHHSATATAAITPASSSFSATAPDAVCDASSDGSSLSIPPSLSDSMSASAASTASTVSHSSHASHSSSSASSPPISRDRLVRVKDKLKHSESENRRRTRLRHKFSLLRDASGCSKKDRYTILTTACSRINELHNRLQQTEHDKASLLLSINNLTQQQQQQQSAGRQHASPSSSLPSLLSYPLLSSVCAALVSVDGRVLDCNSALCAAVGAGRDELTQHTMFALCDSKQLLDSVIVMKRLIEGQCNTWEMRRTLLHRAGHATDMQCTLASVRHEGRLAAFLLLMVPAIQQQQHVTAADGLADLQQQGKLLDWQQSVDGGYSDDFIKREEASRAAALSNNPFQMPPAGDGGYDEQHVHSFIPNNGDGAAQHSSSFAAMPVLSTSAMSTFHPSLLTGTDDGLSGSLVNIKQEAESLSLSLSAMHPASPLAHLPHRTLKRPHPYLSHQLHSHERTSAAVSTGYDNSISAMPPPRPSQAAHGSSQPAISRRLPPLMTIATSTQPPDIHYSPGGSLNRHLSTSSSSTQLPPSQAAMAHSHSMSASGASESRGWSRPSLSAPNSPTTHPIHSTQHRHHHQQQYNQQQQQRYHTDAFVNHSSGQPPWMAGLDGGSGTAGRDEEALGAGGMELQQTAFNSHSFLNMPC